MSNCRYCHQEIVWVRRSPDRWYPPFDAIEPVPIQVPQGQTLLAPGGGSYLTVSDPVLILAKPHDCPEREATKNTLSPFEAPEARRPKPTPPQGFWDSSEKTRIWNQHWKAPGRVQLMQEPCPVCNARVGEPCLSTAEWRDRACLFQPHWQRSRAVRPWSLRTVELDAADDLKDPEKVAQLQDFFRGPGMELFGVESPPSVQLGPSGASSTPLVEQALLPPSEPVETADSESEGEEDPWWSDLVTTSRSSRASSS